MRDYDFFRIVGATILAAGVAVMSNDPSFRILPGPIQTSVPDPSYQQLMQILKTDPLGDKARQFKGDLKRRWANFTDEDLSEIEGNSDRFQEKIRQRYGDRKDELKQWVVDWFDKSMTSSDSPLSHG